MRYIIGLLAISVLNASIAIGETNRGVSWIGQGCHAKADCGAIMSAYKGATNINGGWLYGTFNPTGCKCSKVVLADPRPKTVRVAICNSTCFPERGRRCQKHECFAGMNSRQASKAILADNPALYERVDKTIALAKEDIALAKQPVQFLIQPCLECSVSKEARYKLNEYVASKFPGHLIVDNPVKGPCAPGLICEKHGNVSGNANTIVDLDGVDYKKINKEDFWKKNRQSLMVLAWSPCANGISSTKFVPPLQRYRFCNRKDVKPFQDAIRRRIG